MAVTPLFTQIEKTIELKAGTLVLENHNGFPYGESNLYLVASNGEITWKAEKPDKRALFTKVKLNEDTTISTFTTSGQFCDIDLETGKIISSENFK
jgi:hypothetical protein